MSVQENLFALRDEKYAEFQAKLAPTIPTDSFIGVRVPNVRKLEKELFKSGEYCDFINNLPHRYYDENMLHAMLVSDIKDFDECIKKLEIFLPYVDNWAVCDTLVPRAFNRKAKILLPYIRKWLRSDHVYTIRFGVDMLMHHYLDNDFCIEALDLASEIKSKEYYVNMAIAWFYATALAKQWDSTLPYISENRLDVWIHNKTIQKAKESFRITEEQKALLKSLKR